MTAAEKYQVLLLGNTLASDVSDSTLLIRSTSQLSTLPCAVRTQGKLQRSSRDRYKYDALKYTSLTWYRSVSYHDCRKHQRHRTTARYVCYVSPCRRWVVFSCVVRKQRKAQAQIYYEYTYDTSHGQPLVLTLR